MQKAEKSHQIFSSVGFKDKLWEEFCPLCDKASFTGNSIALSGFSVSVELVSTTQVMEKNWRNRTSQKSITHQLYEEELSFQKINFDFFWTRRWAPVAPTTIFWVFCGVRCSTHHWDFNASQRHGIGHLTTLWPLRLCSTWLKPVSSIP